MAAKQVSF